MEYRPRYCLPHHNAIIMGGCMQHTQTENGVIPRFRHSRTAVWVTIPSELQQWQFWVERGWITVVAPRSINRKLFAHSFKVWFDLRKREYEVIPNLSVSGLYERWECMTQISAFVNLNRPRLQRLNFEIHLCIWAKAMFPIAGILCHASPTETEEFHYSIAQLSWEWLS